MKTTFTPGELVRKLPTSLFIILFILLASTGYSQADVVESTLTTDEQLERNQLISYIAMVLGFMVVIAIAWMSTSKSKRARMQQINNHIPHNHIHDPYRKKSRIVKKSH